MNSNIIPIHRRTKSRDTPAAVHPPPLRAYAITDIDGIQKIPRYSFVGNLQPFPYLEMMRNDHHPEWRRFTHSFPVIRESARRVELIWFLREWRRLLESCRRSGEVGARAEHFSMQLTRSVEGV